jgi:hypothetical protein
MHQQSEVASLTLFASFIIVHYLPSFEYIPLAPLPVIHHTTQHSQNGQHLTVQNVVT